MSDRILHECGLAVVRLLKPLDWYREAHGDLLWGVRRLFLLMEKQHNRGQDGAGIGTVRFDMPPGELFIDRVRSAMRNPIERLFDDVVRPIAGLDEDELAALDGAAHAHAHPLRPRHGHHGEQSGGL